MREYMCKVSVIVPVYNVEKYLKQCLDSLIAQTLKEIEIICVDDGSTDLSLNMIYEYQKHDDRFKIIHQENQGLSSARNAGLKEATGDFIYFCDSDDYIHPSAMEICYFTAKRENVDVLSFNYISFKDGEKNYVEHTSNFPENRTITGIEMLDMAIQSEAYTPSIPLLFINKTYWNANKYFFIQGIIHEDHSFFIEILTTAKSAYHLNEFLYFRRIRAGSIMTTRQHIASAVGMLKTMEYLSYLYGAGLSEKDMSVIEKYFVFCFRLFFNSYILLGNVECNSLKSEIIKFRNTLKQCAFYHCKQVKLFYYGKTIYIFYTKLKNRSKKRWLKSKKK